MTDEIWKNLDSERARHPQMFGGPVEQDAVDSAERALGCSFDPTYAEFLKRYGSALLTDDPILGLRKAKVMAVDLWSVVDATKDFRRDNWPGVEAWYIASVDGAGNPIGIDRQGCVWISDHNTGTIEVVAPDVRTWLLQQTAALEE